MNNFWREFPEIDKDLMKIKNIIKESIRSNENIVEDPLLGLINSGGKTPASGLRAAFRKIWKV